MKSETYHTDPERQPEPDLQTPAKADGEHPLLRIGQVSRLYGISVETLRHYEKQGLLQPAKIADSGYRYYDNRQIWQLNLIRTLRQLDIGLVQIRDFIAERTLDSSEALLQLQLETIEQKQQELARLQQQLGARQSYLQQVKRQLQQPELTCTIRRRTFPARPVSMKRVATSSFWEIDRAHKEIEQGLADEDLAYFARGRAGVLVAEEAIRSGAYRQYNQAFIFDDQGDQQLQAGDYLCLYYRGESPEVIQAHYRQLQQYMQANNLQLAGPGVEVYLLDIHETDLGEEYLTEIQLPCRVAG